MGWIYNVPDGTPTTGPSFTAGELVCTITALLVLLVRLYVRAIMIKAFGRDDILIIIAWIGCCGYTICAVIQTKWGLGIKDLEAFPKDNIAGFGVVQYVEAPFYVVGIWGFKISLLFSYLRFFSERTFRIAANCMICIITAAHIAFIVVFLVGCIPVAKTWFTDLPGHCIDLLSFYLTFASMTIVFDLAVLIMPFPVIMKIQLQTRKKVVLIGLFGLGVFVTIIQAIRIRTIIKLSNALDSGESIIFSTIEMSVGIIISSIPTLAPLFRYFSEKNSSNNRSRDHSGYAMHTFASTKRSGRRPLASDAVSDRDGQYRQNGGNFVATGGHGDNTSSTEDILGMDAIKKTTEVVVTRQTAV